MPILSSGAQNCWQCIVMCIDLLCVAYCYLVRLFGEGVVRVRFACLCIVLIVESCRCHLTLRCTITTLHARSIYTGQIDGQGLMFKSSTALNKEKSDSDTVKREKEIAFGNWMRLASRWTECGK